MCMACWLTKLAPFVPALAAVFGYGVFKCRRALFSSEGGFDYGKKERRD